jgi:polyvinyl alcohol dehydrogenase (cytochrome)
MSKLVIVAVAAVASFAIAYAQAPPAGNGRPAGTESGFRIFQTQCMQCHGNPEAAGRAPSPSLIRELPPEKIYEALITGVMKTQGQKLSDEEKRMTALFMSGRPVGSSQAGDAKSMPNQCANNAPLAAPASGPAWNGWGPDATNGRFQSAKAAGLTIDQVPRLRLKWAFGYPNGVSAFGQPSVVSGRVFVGTDTGFIYSLNAETGCVYWSFEARGSVRNAISMGPVKGRGPAKYAIYFGDSHSNVYAVSAQTGEQLWMTHTDDHFAARITAAPTVYGGRVYVGVSSSEEFAGSTLDYPCCTSRGSVLALDASTGQQIWKTYVVDEPKPTKKNSKGVQQYAPAGASVWNSPTIDPKRKAVYFGTGDSETEPAPKTSDSVMALDMDTGKVLWSYQAQANDAFLGGCGPNTKTENCPAEVGPDWDIGNSPILRTLSDGRRAVVAGTKNGDIFALDPDNKGALLWRVNIADKPRTGIVWGGAADEQNVYYGLSGGGVVAVRLANGEKRWYSPLGTSAEKRSANSAATSAIPGVVFNGGSNGVLNAVASEDGHTLWQFDTAREFDTVNKIKARGGSMSAPGPVVAGGMVFVGSGYAVLGDVRAGNVLLAFSAAAQ